MKKKVVEVMLLGSSITGKYKLKSFQRELDYYSKLAESYDIKIFEYSSKTQESNPLIKIIRLISNKWVKSTLGALLFAYKNTKPDIVRTKQFWGCWAAIIIAYVSRVPLVIRCGYIWSKSFEIERFNYWREGKSIIGFFESTLMNYGDAFIFCTDEISEYYSQFIGDKKSVIIPNSYNLDIFNNENNFKKEFDFIFVGRLIDLKGINRMITLIPKNMSLIVIGAGNLKDSLANKDNIEIIDHLNNYDISDYYKKSKFYISMSLTEGNPKATFEAILCGCYPILSDISPHKMIIDELGYGKIISSESSLGNLMQLTIDKDKLERFSMKYCIDEAIKAEKDFIDGLIK